MAHPATVGLILAGGRSQRMGGGDKVLRALGGRAILTRVVERLQPSCAALLLNANGDAARFADLALPVIADDLPDFPGPLAGIVAGLDHIASHMPAIAWMVVVAGDCPFLPTDLVARLHGARQVAGLQLACAMSDGRDHPVVSLWPVDIRHVLRRAVATDGLRKVGLFLDEHGCARAEWPVVPVDPFLNINRPEDLGAAEAALANDPSL